MKFRDRKILIPSKSTLVAILLATLVGSLIACSVPKGDFFYGTLGLGTPRLLVATANTGALNILMYDLEGNLLKVVWDSTAANDTPRGIAPYDAFSFAILMDGVDRIARGSIIGETHNDISTDSNLAGTLYQLDFDPVQGQYYAIEGNFIEGFTKNGARLGNPLITTTIGGCTLNVPRGLAVNGTGSLAVVGTGNDVLNIYNVSGTTVTCANSNSILNTFDPIAVIKHSDGRLYVATQGNDRIYSFPANGTGSGSVVWNTNLTYINNPTALVELPDGSILVASDGTNSIERITTAGTLVGSTSFIRDGFTGLVTQMLLIGAQ